MTATTISDTAAETAIEQSCRILTLPTIRQQAGPLAAQAARNGTSHRGYLAELLMAEVDDRAERRRQRRIKEARFPRVKHLDDFDTAHSPVTAATLAALGGCGWIDAAEPVVVLGDSGTGKSHLLIGLGIAACGQGRRVRYTTAAGLVNELAEAHAAKTLARTVGRWARLDLLCLDELGYLHLDPVGAELLFQILTEREERASIAAASNLPFSEWAASFRIHAWQQLS